MYKSPLDKLYGEIQTQIVKQNENNCMCAITQSLGYAVDKQELIKALSYDRDQYNKGYNDALDLVRDNILHIHEWAFDRQNIAVMIDNLRKDK